MNFFHCRYGHIFELADVCTVWNIPYSLESVKYLDGFILRFPSGADIAVNYGISLASHGYIEFGGTGDPDLDYHQFTAEEAAKIIPKIINRLVK